MFKFLNKKTFAVLFAVILIIGAHYLGWTRPVENLLLKVFQPAEKALYRAGNALKLIYQKSAVERDWESDNKRLDDENKRLLAENVGLKIITDENKALREQLAFYSRSNYQKTVANVISRAETVGDNQVITLDRGGADGVKAGQAIVAGDGMIIGKIFFIKEKISYGYLITNEQCELAASIVNQERTAGLTKGELGLTVRLNFISQTENIASSSIVITSGLEPAIPRGLIIGKIIEVDQETNDLFQSAVVSPAADLSGLTIVSVIK